jgi:hypothetical protein
MPEAWPGTLPQEPLYDGFSETAPNTVLRTRMDAGPPKQRRRYTAGVRVFSMSLVLTKAQVAVLDDFYLNALNGGVDAFTWQHPRTLAAASLRFAGEPPTYKPWSDDCWTATLTLEILP